MQINPMDIMKSQEASQVKHFDSHRSQNEQVQIGRDFQNVIQKEQKKTNQATKGDNKENRYDAKEKGNNNYFGSAGKRREQKENKKELKNPTKSGGIDILI